MRRSRRIPLRGSVTQSTIRVRAAKPSLTGFLMRLGALVGAVLVLIATMLWLWHIGWPQHQAGRLKEAGLRLTQDAQFAVKDIVVEGREQTSREAVMAALGNAAEPGAPILAFDPATAQTRIAKLPWVASVAVERRLPGTILVHLAERVPQARWQHGDRTVVIDMDGKELPDAKLSQFGDLPLVVGADAPPETRTLLTQLQSYPSIEHVVTAAVRVSERRWDLHLERNIVARLPEKGVDEALKRLSALIENEKVLERNVSAIDLRLPDRLFIEPATANQKSGDAKL